MSAIIIQESELVHPKFVKSLINSGITDGKKLSKITSELKKLTSDFLKSNLSIEDYLKNVPHEEKISYYFLRNIECFIKAQTVSEHENLSDRILLLLKKYHPYKDFSSRVTNAIACDECQYAKKETDQIPKEYLLGFFNLFVTPFLVSDNNLNRERVESIYTSLLQESERDIALSKYDELKVKKNNLNVETAFSTLQIQLVNPSGGNARNHRIRNSAVRSSDRNISPHSPLNGNQSGGQRR